jgi:excisionase family DNA binding protein
MQKNILSTADVARLFDVTETTVKRWADEGTLRCQKTPGGHRKFDIKHIVEFAEQNDFDPIGVLAVVGETHFSPLLQVAVLARDFPTLAEEFTTRALSSEIESLLPYLSYLYEHKISIWEMHDLVIRPGMHEIGEAWARGEAGIDQEHRASYKTLDALAKLQTQVLIKPPTGKSVVLACLGEELHDIGLRCASCLFEAEGWKVHYLGARIPEDAVVRSIGAVSSSVVVLSTSTEEVLEASIGELERMHAAAGRSWAILAVGGRAAAPQLIDRGLCEEILTSSRDVVDLIHRVNKDTGPKRKESSGPKKVIEQ